MLHLYFKPERLGNYFLMACLLCLPALSVIAQTTQRNGLAEEFSASTCHPCKDLNDEYHPACVSIGVNDTATHVNAMAYQMDYPGNGDLSFNLHCQQRYSYYNLWGLPSLKINGKGIATNALQPALYTALDTSRQYPSWFKINGTYLIDAAANKLRITVNIIPLISLNGKYRVHIAAVERHYANYTDTADVDMPDYYHVMRRMFPDGNGKAENSWTANVTKTYTYTVNYYVNNPPMMGSFDFWGNPYQSDLIAFVQDSTSKRIMQSQVIKPAWYVASSISELNNSISNVMCYPNPAKDYLHVGFTLEQKQNVQVQLIDLMGRELYVNKASLDAGAHQFNLPVQQFLPGVYTIQLSTGSGKLTRQHVISPQ